MTAVRAAFDRLMAAHREVGSPLPQCLRPPIEPAQLAQVEQRMGAQVPPGVVQWYECADGVDVSRWNDVAVAPPRLAGADGPEFAPLEEVCAAAEELAAIAADVEPPGTIPPGEQAAWEERWRLAWYISGGECVAVDCVTAPGTLWVVRWEVGDIRPLEWDTAGFLNAAADHLGSFQWSPGDGHFVEAAETGDEPPDWPEIQSASIMRR